MKIRLCNNQLKIVNSEKHLGHLLTNKQSIMNIDEVMKDMKIKTNIICNEFSSLPYAARIVIFNSQCLSLYGCPLWNLQDTKIEDLCKTWRVCCRRILGIPNRTHNELLPELMNTFPIINIIQERMINFYMNGLNHSDSVVVRFFQNSITSHLSYSVANVNKILNRIGMRYFDFFTYKKKDVKKKFKCIQTHDNDSVISLLKDLLDMRDGIKMSNLNHSEIRDIIQFVCVTQ